VAPLELLQFAVKLLEVTFVGEVVVGADGVGVGVGVSDSVVAEAIFE